MRVGLLALLLTISALHLPAQEADNALTIHATTTTVLVDVVVKDHNRHAVHGLTQGSFVLTENKQPQSIVFCEEHHSQAALPSMPKLPPGVFTNLTTVPAGAAVDVILVDTLNTEPTDQPYLRAQLLDVVNHSGPARSVAIFGLSNELHMLQGFTSDPAVLRGALNSLASKASPLLTNPVTSTGVQQSLDFALTHNRLDTPGQVQISAQALYEPISALARRLRIQLTLDALNELARYLSAIQGRKNLIWLSGSFPVNLEPSAASSDSGIDFTDAVYAESEYRETDSLLSRSQVAVYPIDAHGLVTTSYTKVDNLNAGRYAGNPQTFANDDQAFFHDEATSLATMQRIAEDTGGKAFAKRNNLTQAVEDAFDDGANFYTIAYTPRSRRKDGSYRKIEVKIPNGGFTLAYRRGYYEDRSPAARQFPAPPAPAASSLQKAMLHGVPPATQVIYKIQVQPVSTELESKPEPHTVVNARGYAPVAAPFQRYQVLFAFNPGDITFTSTTRGLHKADLTFVSSVYDPTGQIVCSRSDTFPLSLSDVQYDGLRKGPISFAQQLSIPDNGNFTLRTAVIDAAADRMGSFETSVSDFKNLPAMNVAAGITAAKP